MWSNLALSFDYLRCANPDNNPVWAAEFQGGPVMSDFQKGQSPFSRRYAPVDAYCNEFRSDNHFFLGYKG